MGFLVYTQIYSRSKIAPEVKRSGLILTAFSTLILLLYFAHSAYFQVRPIGSDFVSFWTAAKAVLDQNSQLPYDFNAFSALQDTYFGYSNVAFFYPPFFLLLIAPFGVLPYGLSYAVFQFLSLAGAAFAIGKILGSLKDSWLALAVPGFLFCVMHGQTSLLCVFFFGTALAALAERRMVPAGIFIGLLAIKPQFGLLIPFALLAGGYYRTFAAASATTLLLGAISLMIFGFGTWAAFLEQSGLAYQAMVSGLISPEKLASPFGWLLQLGIPADISIVVQTTLSISITVWVVICWRKLQNFNLKALLLSAGACLATPFMLDYDLALLAIPLAFAICLNRDTQFTRVEGGLLLASVLLQFATQGFALTMPVTAGPFPAALLFLFASRRALAELRSAPGPASDLAGSRE
jgi:hypothetical protein